MRIAVVGATGSIGAPVVTELRECGHEVRALSRSSPEFPVDLVSGEGLAEALEGCDVTIDASNAGPAKGPARAVLIEGGKRLLTEAERAGVGHHLPISIIGIEHIPFPYYRIKVEQERLVRESGVPFTIVRATQFHTLLEMLFSATVRFRLLPGLGARLQPVDPVEVAAAIADMAEAGPASATRTIAGPEVQPLSTYAKQWRAARGRRALIARLPIPGKLGRAARQGALTDPDPDARGTVTFAEWLERDA